MLSFLKTDVPRTNRANEQRSYYEGGRSWNEFRKNGYLTTQSLPPADGQPSFFYPPPHRHTLQAEYFEVLQGTGEWSLYNRKTILSKGEKITIPRGAPHTFVNISKDEPLVIGASYSESSVWDDEGQERFFRNVFGYFDDCKKAQVEPSLPQICLICYEASMPVALFPGPEMFAYWADRFFTFFVGNVVGAYILGYSASYPEYYEPKQGR